jgi:hypothetical protein
MGRTAAPFGQRREHVSILDANFDSLLATWGYNLLLPRCEVYERVRELGIPRLEQEEPGMTTQATLMVD